MTKQTREWTNRLQILFLTNIPNPYRNAFFNELGKYVDLTVIYERTSADNREKTWTTIDADKYKCVYLCGIKTGHDTAWCPTVIKYINYNYDYIIIGGYSTPTGMFAIEYCLLHKIPFILNTDGGFIKDDSKLKYWLKKHFMSSSYAYLCAGTGAIQMLIHYGVKKNKIYSYPFTSVPNKDVLTSTLSTTEKIKIRDGLGLHRKHMILTVGQFVPRKGIDTLIKASRNLHDTDVVVVGGKVTDEFLELVNVLHIDYIHFPGFFSKSILLQYYRAADIFVFPTRYDIWGLVINEAIAAGLPVITTDKCAAAIDLVKNDQNGYIVPVDDIKSIHEHIIKILDSSDIQHNFSIKSLQIAKEYTIENMVQSHLSIFRSITANE